MGEGVIPERIEGETAKAYRAFVDYCEMGAGRAVPGLWARYRHETDTKLTPTKRLRTLKGWSAQNNWQERVAEYERRAAEQRTQQRIQKQIEIEDRAVNDGSRMLDWWDQRWDQFEQTPKGTTPYSAREMAKLRREVDDLVRRALGLPDRVTESTSTLKGIGEGGALEHRVIFAWDDGTDNEDQPASATHGETETDDHLSG